MGEHIWGRNAGWSQALLRIMLVMGTSVGVFGSTETLAQSCNPTELSACLKGHIQSREDCQDHFGCPSDKVCTAAGHCVCPASKHLCGGTCVATTKDKNNCGMCGTKCTVSQVCTAGTCACSAGKTACGASCCTGNQVCTAGSCASPASPASSHCLIGSEVTIPGSDASKPSVVIVFLMPDGSTPVKTDADPSSTITVPANGIVSVIAVTRDPQGVKDSRIFAADIRCGQAAGGPRTCTGPGLLGRPTASNPETNAVGQTGCTARLVSQNLQITDATAPNGSSKTVSWEVHVEGENFGGQVTSTQMFTLSR